MTSRNKSELNPLCRKYSHLQYLNCFMLTFLYLFSVAIQKEYIEAVEKGNLSSRKEKVDAEGIFNKMYTKTNSIVEEAA